jgi:hypothetical protein
LTNEEILVLLSNITIVSRVKRCNLLMRKAVAQRVVPHANPQVYTGCTVLLTRKGASHRIGSKTIRQIRKYVTAATTRSRSLDPRSLYIRRLGGIVEVVRLTGSTSRPKGRTRGSFSTTRWLRAVILKDNIPTPKNTYSRVSIDNEIPHVPEAPIDVQTNSNSANPKRNPSSTGQIDEWHTHRGAGVSGLWAYVVQSVWRVAKGIKVYLDAIPSSAMMQFEVSTSLTFSVVVSLSNTHHPDESAELTQSLTLTIGPRSLKSSGITSQHMP